MSQPSEKRRKAEQSGPGSVLVLGFGLIARPLVHYLAKRDVSLTIATRTVSKVESEIAEHKDVLGSVKTAQLDMEAGDSAIQVIEELTQTHDVVISLLPYIYHVQAARVALKHGKHFCTTSYVSDEMAAMDADVRARGLTFLNECGVDPGLDHMSAQKVIDHVHDQGGRIISFYSICGGLPAPMHNNNPLGYKLSWSPRGVLLASRNNALFLRDGQQVSVPGPQLFQPENVGQHFIGGDIGTLEWYPNRDSVKYRDIYSVPEVQTLIRGTYRYPGWSHFMQILTSRGFATTDPIDRSLCGRPYSELTRSVLKLDSSTPVKSAAAALLKLPEDDNALFRMEWLGMFSDDLKVPENAPTVLDAVCHLFERSLQYAHGEKDMICMRHVFEVEYKNGDRQTLTSTLVDYGLQPDGASSMSRTVSLPLAIAIYSLLKGELKETGVIRPVQRSVYNPILSGMENEGIVFQEQTLSPLLWLRSEVKPGEERVILTPNDVASLIAAGYRVTVERSPHRCIKDEEYGKVGAELVEAGSWVAAPRPAFILGLKELPDSPPALVHRHIFFAHCFKNQGGWKDVLARFRQGGGSLYDLEFLVNDAGRRVAAFGRPAGVAGMGVGLLTWAHQQLGSQVGALSSWASMDVMISEVRALLDKAQQSSGRRPKAIVIGALGRCGGGAVHVAEQCGVEVTKWDLDETKGGGPFPQLLEFDVCVNAIYLTDKIPPFMSRDMLNADTRKASVLVDVSCDVSNPNNPFPFCDRLTYMTEPTYRVVDGPKPFDIVAIDHLPTLIPVESSQGFSSDLVPHIAHLNQITTDPVWQRAEKLFHEKMQAALQ